MPEQNALPRLEAKRPEGKELHWLVVGYVSPGAKEWIEQLGGHVVPLTSYPPMVAVALVYDPAGTWVWSHGRQEHRGPGLEFWNTGEIQEPSTGINLLCPRNAEYRSVETNYLILPDEEYDEQTGQVKEPSRVWQEMQEARVAPPAPPYDDDLGDLDDHPF